jgi:Na+/proline symporter
MNWFFAKVSYAWAGLGSSFGPALLLALWWNKTTGRGVLAGMMTGTLVTIVWSGFANVGCPGFCTPCSMGGCVFCGGHYQLVYY